MGWAWPGGLPLLAARRRRPPPPPPLLLLLHNGRAGCAARKERANIGGERPARKAAAAAAAPSVSALSNKWPLVGRSISPIGAAAIAIAVANAVAAQAGPQWTMDSGAAKVGSHAPPNSCLVRPPNLRRKWAKALELRAGQQREASPPLAAGQWKRGARDNERKDDNNLKPPERSWSCAPSGHSGQRRGSLELLARQDGPTMGASARRRRRRQVNAASSRLRPRAEGCERASERARGAAWPPIPTCERRLISAGRRRPFRLAALVEAGGRAA